MSPFSGLRKSNGVSGYARSRTEVIEYLRPERNSTGGTFDTRSERLGVRECIRCV